MAATSGSALILRSSSVVTIVRLESLLEDFRAVQQPGTSFRLEDTPLLVSHNVLCCRARGVPQLTRVLNHQNRLPPNNRGSVSGHKPLTKAAMPAMYTAPMTA